MGREAARVIGPRNGRAVLVTVSSDYIGASASSDNVIQNPMMTGTGGTLGAGATGVVADNWTATAGTATSIACMKGSNDEGMVLTVVASGEQIATVTGGTSAFNHVAFGDRVRAGLRCSTDSSGGSLAASVEARFITDQAANHREFNAAATTLGRTPFPNEQDVTNFVLLSPNPDLNINPASSSFEIRLHAPAAGTYIFTIGQATARKS